AGRLFVMSSCRDCRIIKMNGCSMITISEINECNRRFWDEQNELRDRRMSDPVIREAAFARFFDEQARGVPLRNQTTIEKFLADGEADKRRFLSQQGRKGGQTKRPDALQEAILDIVRRRPEITEARLRDLLTRERFPELITDIDEDTIWFVQSDGPERKRLKEAPISGLKHRLSRAKKTLKSR